MDAERHITGSSTVSADTETECVKLVDISEVMSDVYTRIDSLYAEQGLKTGFKKLDEVTTGFYPGEYIVIGARPAMGKTAFALNLLEYTGIKKKKQVIYFSISENSGQIGLRLLSLVSGIDIYDLKEQRRLESDHGRLLDAMDRICSSNIVIDDNPTITVAELGSKCRKMKIERGLDLVIIDYLQLMSADGLKYNENRQQEISEISRSLKVLARELECPVVVLSQLSRAVERRFDKRPILSDVRGSGDIEQDADLVMFLYRDGYYHPDSEHKGEAEVIIAKQKNGPTGTVKLCWKPETMRFANW